MRDLKKYTDQYMKSNFEDYQVEYRKKEVLKHFRENDSRRILEIGCGMNPFFLSLEEDEYDAVSIVEPSEMFYRNALNEAQGNEKIVCVNSLFEDFVEGWENKSEFDFIICSSLIHELENPLNFLNTIYKCCTKKTIVHINVPNANSFHRVLGKLSGKIKDVHEMTERNIRFQQNQVFDMGGLLSIVESSGFEVIKKGSYFIKPFTHAQMYQIINQEIIDENILDALYEMGRYLPELGSEIYVDCKAKK